MVQPLPELALPPVPPWALAPALVLDRALDRALQWQFLVIPHWHLPYTRIAFWDKFGYPAITPLQGVQLNAWWIDPAKAAALAQQKGGGTTAAEKR